MALVGVVRCPVCGDEYQGNRNVPDKRCHECAAREYEAGLKKFIEDLFTKNNSVEDAVRALAKIVYDLKIDRSVSSPTIY